MRRLAASLVADSSAADDVVQEAWAKLGGESAPAGYLAAIVRTLAFRHRRGEVRLRQREEGVAVPEALPSAAEVAERIEIVQRLAQALDELDEPYKTTLVLRYFDDLTAAEIGRRSRIPSSTVRVRLKRGIEKLRTALDDEQGGRENWVSALVPLAIPTRNLHSVPLLGLTTMVTMKLILGSVIVVCALAIFWIQNSMGAASGSSTLSAEKKSLVSDLVAMEEGEGKRLVDVAKVDERSPVSAAKLTTTGSENEATSGSGRISARVVRPDGTPISSSWLRLRQMPEISAFADSEGRIELELTASRMMRFVEQHRFDRIRVEVGASGYQTVQLQPSFGAGRTSLELGEIELGIGSVVSGLVVDELGVGTADALVVFGSPALAVLDLPSTPLIGPRDLNPGGWASVSPAIFTRTGPDGRFRLEGLTSGYGIVWARGAYTHWAFAGPVGLRRGDALDGIRLVVSDARDELITGVVVDPLGSPLPGIRLKLNEIQMDGAWSNVLTDAQGRFYFAPHTETPFDILAHSPSLEWENQRTDAVLVGTHNLVIKFESSKWLEVLVSDRDGKPIRNGTVVALPGEGPTENELPRSESSLDGGGQARLRRPDAALRVRVRAPGYRDALLGPFEPTRSADPLIVTLEALPALIGQVLLPDGRPAEGAVVQLHRGAYSRRADDAPATRKLAYLTHQSWTGDREPFVYALHREFQEQVFADEEGRFRLSLPGVDASASEEVKSATGGGLSGLGYVDEGNAELVATSKPDRPWYVHTELEGYAAITSGPLYFDSIDEKKLELRLPGGGEIVGRLVIKGGVSPAGWRMLASDGLGQIAEASVSEDGEFHFANLHPGGWQLRAFGPGLPGWNLSGNTTVSHAPEPEVQILASETVTYEHITRVREDAELRGRFSLDGSSPGAWTARIVTSTEQSVSVSRSAILDPDGKFELSFEAGLKTELHLFRPPGEDPIQVVETLITHPGRRNWSFDLETASLEGFVPSSPSDQSKIEQLVFDVKQGERTIRALISVGEDGRFGPTLVPAGYGMLRTSGYGSRPEDTVLDELSLVVGESRVIDLR